MRTELWHESDVSLPGPHRKVNPGRGNSKAVKCRPVLRRGSGLAPKAVSAERMESDCLGNRILSRYRIEMSPGYK